MGWLSRKRDKRLVKQVGRSLSQLPPLRMTPQLRLFGSYMQVRNTLAGGGDPTKVAAEGHELPVNALGYFRAGLKITYDTEDELAAFDSFARELNDQGVTLHHRPDEMTRLEAELQMVRDALSHQRPDEPPLPPD